MSRALTRALYRQGPIAIAANPLIAGILIWALLGHVDSGRLYAWFAAMVLISIVRILLLLAYHRRADADAQAARWARIHTAGATVAGLAWGVGGVLLSPDDSFGLQVLLLFVIGGMSAGALTTHAPCLPAFYGFMLTSLPPALAQFTWYGTREHAVFAVVATVFLLLMVQFARSWNRFFQQTYRLEFAHARLVRDLTVANRAKTEFLANMSHELRTPLNAIIGFSESMEKEIFGKVDSDLYKGFARDIKESGQHLLGVINDILDLANIEVDKVELDETEIDLSELIGQVILALGERAKTAQLTLDARLASRLPGLLADTRKLKKILLNLLGNSIKFTPPGGQVSIMAEEGADGSLVVRVQDTGIGIAPDKLQLAFERFAQIDGGPTRRHGGVGIGLPLAKALIELHGGSLSVESRIGEGTTVTVAFPPARVIRPAAAREMSA